MCRNIIAALLGVMLAAMFVLALGLFE